MNNSNIKMNYLTFHDEEAKAGQGNDPVTGPNNRREEETPQSDDYN